MHRMNANRVSNLGTTSSLSDNSVQRIKDGVEDAAQRRTQRHASKTTIKKTAQKLENPEPKDTNRIIVASIKDIPDNFERVGTGFFREGHHLWELTRAEGGYVLVRKQGEDHVLNYDHEPLEKHSSILDRRGVVLKRGSKVRFPHRGKIATGTVVVLTPSALGVDIGSGGAVDVPPDMLESFVEEESVEGKHSPEVTKGLGREEKHEEEHGSDKEGDASTEILEELVEEEAQEGEHSPEVLIGLEEFVEEEEEEEHEEGGGVFEPDIEASSKIEDGPIGSDANQPLSMMASADLKNWKDYWRSVGQRVAQAQENKPPKPKLTDAEKAQRAKERREKLRHERKGLPPDAKLPPKPKKMAVLDGEKESVFKEKLRLYEQLIDEFKYILTTEPLDPQEVPLADQFMQALDAFEEEKEKLGSEEEKEIEEELDLEVPSKMEQEENKGHKVVSMADLV